MRIGKSSLLGAAAVCVVGVFFVAAPRASGADTEEAGVKKHSAAFVAAWNRHDPKAMAALWADDGDILNPWGNLGTGRAGVEKVFMDDQTGKGPLRDSTFELKSESVRFPTADVCVDDWEVSVTGAHDPDGSKHPTPMTFHNTIVLKKVGGSWMNYACRPYLTAVQPASPTTK